MFISIHTSHFVKDLGKVASYPPQDNGKVGNCGVLGGERVSDVLTNLHIVSESHLFFLDFFFRRPHLSNPRNSSRVWGSGMEEREGKE